MGAPERLETINIIACAGDDVLSEFEITFRYGQRSVLLGALVNGTEVGPAIAATASRFRAASAATSVSRAGFAAVDLASRRGSGCGHGAFDGTDGPPYGNHG